MKTVITNNPWNLLGRVLPLFTLMLFFASCQEEEDTLGKTQQTYEELTAEMENLSSTMKKITDRYPAYQIDMKSIFQIPKEKVAKGKFEKAITGVDNVADKRKISEIHYQIHQLREKMFGLPDASGTYAMVDDQPSPEAGMQEFYDYISKNLVYPTQARQMGIEGRVFVEFVVDADGTITEVKTVKGIGAGCDKEAERILKNAAAWNPGRLDGKPVKVRMVLPITYKLSGNS